MQGRQFCAGHPPWIRKSIIFTQNEEDCRLSSPCLWRTLASVASHAGHAERNVALARRLAAGEHRRHGNAQNENFSILVLLVIGFEVGHFFSTSVCTRQNLNERQVVSSRAFDGASQDAARRPLSASKLPPRDRTGTATRLRTCRTASQTPQDARWSRPRSPHCGLLHGTLSACYLNLHLNRVNEESLLFVFLMDLDLRPNRTSTKLLASTL